MTSKLSTSLPELLVVTLSGDTGKPKILRLDGAFSASCAGPAPTLPTSFPYGLAITPLRSKEDPGQVLPLWEDT